MAPLILVLALPAHHGGIWELMTSPLMLPYSLYNSFCQRQDTLDSVKLMGLKLLDCLACVSV